MTGDAVDYRPFQEEGVLRQFPEIPREHAEEAVQLVMPDGAAYEAAEAVFRCLAAAKRERWLLWLYRKIPAFTVISETLYHEVAVNRTFLSRVDRVVFGERGELPQYVRVRYIFLRGLALIYFLAFFSLATQIDGLLGSQGVAPAKQTMSAISEAAATHHLGWEKFRLFPTLAWFSVSDRSLDWQCRAGMALSALLLVGVAPAPVLFLLWLVYLSIVTVGEPFLNFQWDMLLLETGFLAIFVAPLQWFEAPSSRSPPSRLAIWLLRWLLFRLMFESGCVKLMSADSSWWNLSALNFHFETQPLPTWIAWHAQQLSAGFLRWSVAMMFVIELLCPILIFVGRKPRWIAAGAFVALQAVILLTGNYTFFNWLTILLCVPLLDDGALERLWPRAARQAFAGQTHWLRWPTLVTLPLTIIVVLVTSVRLSLSMGVQSTWSRFGTALCVWLEPLRSFNGYGLFAVMTRIRPEIIIEGSDDGKTWSEYEFKYKPGDVKQKPRFVAPMQPRLDWQMWFAALGNAQRNPWILGLEYRLLQNAKPVTDLLAKNPFQSRPPRYIRALLYEYHFTDAGERRATGAWWTRRAIGVYIPPLTLQSFEQPQ